MYKAKDYKYYEGIIDKVAKLESINRSIDYSVLNGLSTTKDEEILEFASTNNIEGDIVSISNSKLFIKNIESITKTELEKRWIGIKRASDYIWNSDFNVNPEYINEVHRFLLRDVDIVGGIYKTKINQVGSLITIHPEDVSAKMFDLYSTYITNSIDGGDIYLIIPFISEFLAIHPYEDGNGRMSRLLMNKLLYEAGYKFAKYISISKFLWDKKDAYISALEHRNKAWGRNELTTTELIPLFNVILDSLIAAASKALKYSRESKISFNEFRKQIKDIKNEFSFNDVRKNIPSQMGDATYKKWISNLVKENLLTKTGERKSTKYKVNK